MATSFRTEIQVSPRPFRLNSESIILTTGSCFAVVIGQKIKNYKVNTLVNPFGTIFNPISLFSLLDAGLFPEQPFTGNLVARDERWYAYDLHSSFSAPNQEDLLFSIQKARNEVYSYLASADVLILTLGTAVGYLHKESNQLVANCHKIAQQQFEKKLISTAEITATFSALYLKLKHLNPKLQVIVTVSPVRHIKETLELNSVSKSILRIACHEIAGQLADVTYFPAYELLLDDLRDYRFYKRDMIHPSEEAEDYIWGKFIQAFFEEPFQQFTKEWDKIKLALAHKPFHPDAPAHQQFLRNTLAKLEQIHLHTDCSQEIAQVKSQLR
ncbi:GSCFA domain-containing protein [Adhaeribacter aquaticus]|uniref:GSCFA domain-containing protein n=1 Tax=Adhaeribacter aquaticus TaxID=299567 RepID=UPI00040294DD|nr:GSCFA domain-containing protein [Adhaeribacter aquaticus]